MTQTTVRRLLVLAQSDPAAALAVAFRAAGLSAREQHVLLARLEGRTAAEVGGDRQLRRPGGGDVTGERVRQVEAVALRKLGVRFTIRDLHERERAGRAAVLRRRARLAEWGALVRLTGTDQTHTELTAEEARLERQADRLLAGAGR
jgi:hypothetical protein